MDRKIQIARLLLFALFISAIFFTQSFAAVHSWTQTTSTEFNLGTKTNVSTEVAPGSVVLKFASDAVITPESAAASSINGSTNVPNLARDGSTTTYWQGNNALDWISFLVANDAYITPEQAAASSINGSTNVPNKARDGSTANGNYWEGNGIIDPGNLDWISFLVANDAYITPESAVASSTNGSINVPNKARDGSTANGNYWEGNGIIDPGNLDWITFTLNSSSPVNNVSGIRVFGEYYQTFKLQVSNDSSTWTTVEANAFTGQGGWTYFNFTPQNVKFIRLYYTDNGPDTGFCYLREFGYRTAEASTATTTGIRLYGEFLQNANIELASSSEAKYVTIEANAFMGEGGWTHFSWSPTPTKYIRINYTNNGPSGFCYLREFGFRTADPLTYYTSGVKLWDPEAGQTADIQVASSSESYYTTVEANFSLGSLGWTTINWASRPTKYIRVNYRDNGVAGFCYLTEFNSLDTTFFSLGTLESSTFDTGGSSSFETISWNPASQIPQTGSNSLKFQVATSIESNPTVWNFRGPTGPSSYYTLAAAEPISLFHSGDRYIRYRAYFSTSSDLVSPRLDDITISYTDLTPPVVTLEAPSVGGIELTPGSSYVISWEATDNSGLPASDNISLYYSRNGGVNWTLITSWEENDPGSDTGTFEWTVPNIGSNIALISIEARDAGNNKGYDISDNPFTIFLPLVYVANLTGSDTTGTGTKELPFKTVQKGLNCVNQGGVVSVEAGRYIGAGNYNIRWPARDNITLKGAAMNNTTMDAQSLNRLITLESAVSLTIEAITLNNGYITQDVEGINAAGGGIYLIDGSYLKLKNVMMNNCRSDAGFGRGGAISALNSRVRAQNCVFSNNGYRSVDKKTPFGGVSYYGSWEAINCIFRGNYAHEGGISYNGIWYAENCLFYNNNVHNAGGIARNSQWTAVNCTFGYNSAYLPTSGYGGIASQGTWDIKNCILWGNTAETTGQVFESMTSVAAQYSDIQPNGYIPGTGNISVEPLFISTSEPVNFHLLTTSECIDSGTYVGAPPYDLEGTKRPQAAGDDTINFDMGCYDQAGSGIPMINVVQPNGGEVLSRSSSYNVIWQITDAVSGNVKIRLSTNEGSTWDTLIYDDVAAIGVSSFMWTVPNIITNECLISVEAAGPGGSNYDTSNGLFEISDITGASPEMIGVYINGARALPDDIISSVSTIQIRATSLLGITSVEAYIYPELQKYILDLSLGSIYDGTWSKQITIPSGRHEIRIIARDIYNVPNEASVFINVMSGSVQVVGTPLNYPNPFRPLSGGVTNIQYNLSVDSNVTIILYDITGQEVKRMTFSGGAEGGRAGINAVSWNGRDLGGKVVGNGMYIYKIISKDRVLGTGKLVILDR